MDILEHESFDEDAPMVIITTTIADVTPKIVATTWTCAF
jgi:hypothetical protein